jgi:hypothetical protein
MAHQTSAIQRKQATLRPIGRLMDADFLGESAGPWHSRRNGTCVTAVKAGWLNVTLANHRNTDALDGVLGTARNTLLCPRCVPSLLEQAGFSRPKPFFNQQLNLSRWPQFCDHSVTSADVRL